MKPLLLLPLLASAALATASAAEADPAPALTPAPIVSLALFKNGTAVVTRRVVPPADGAPLLLDGRLAPAHGLFWTDSAAPLAIKASVRRVALPPESIPERGSRAETYAGREATVWARVPEGAADALRAVAAGAAAATFSISAPAGDEPAATVALRGVVLPPKKAARPEARTESFAWYGWSRYEAVSRTTPAGRDGDFALRLENGSVVRIPEAAIAAVSAEGGDSAEIPVLEIAGATAPFEMQYLARGATWAPSYRLALGKDGTARLEMAAEIRNEMEDLDGAEVFLVSGFPNVEAAEIPGLLASGNSISRFLDSLARPTARHGGGHSAYMSQMAWTMNSVDFADLGGASDALPQIPGEGNSADIHYRAAGRVTLASGETLRLTLGAGETPAAHLVDWAPSFQYDNWGNRQDSDGDRRVPWDAVRFRNPLDAPLTTGPMLATADGRPLGQTTVRWTNPGQEAFLRITKALTVPGSFEESIVGRREDYPRVDLLGRAWRRIEIEAKLTMSNHRPEPAKLCIHPTIEGEFKESSETPASVRTLGEPGSRGGANPKQELVWNLELQPGESKVLTYRYTTLVWH
jgi:hypothetical protein